MEVWFEHLSEKINIHYAQTLASSLKQKKPVAHVIILTNQRYYDRFSSKMTGLFSPAEVDWFICTNRLYCNNLAEFMEVVEFLSQFPKHKKYLFLGFGNEGIMDLMGFVQKTTVLVGDYWLIPVSVRSFARALLADNAIVKQPNIQLLQGQNLPKRILFDQTISENQKEGKLVDLFVFIRCGILCDHSFLQSLYRNFSTPQKLQQRALTAMTDQLLAYYQKDGAEIEEFGRVFAKAFYVTENGHLLSDTMKHFFGILFHLIWTLSVGESEFQLENFLTWLRLLGFPLALPPQISISEYLENVMILQSREKKLLFLSEIGRMGVRRYATESELIQTAMVYQEKISEIRGD